MSTLLIRNARYIVSCDDYDTLHENVNLFIRDGVVEYIGPKLCHAEATIDASRMAVYPGLINTHHHLYQIFSRNLPQVQRMELFPWLVTSGDSAHARRKRDGSAPPATRHCSICGY